MMSSALEYWVRLGMAFGSGNDRTDEIIRLFGNAETFYRENGAEAIERLTQSERQRLCMVTLDDAKRVVEQMESGGITILTPDDVRYPNRLRDICGMPCVLYVEGELGGIDERLAIAMVGTRKCSDYGFRASAKLSGELARAGAVVVSGFAVGVDTACHTAAVNADGTTVAVLGCGIDKNYPAQNHALRQDVVRRGAIVTEYAPGTEPHPANFPKRNRIISGLSVGVIVVEAGLHSGSLITAGLAAEQGRDVFAVPGDIFRPTSAGTFRLLQQGCAPIQCGADIIEEYRYRFSLTLEAKQLPEPPMQQITLAGMSSVSISEPPGLTGDALEIFRLLAKGTARVEELAQSLEKPVRTVLTELTQLELLGTVAAMPGGRYELKPLNGGRSADGRLNSESNKLGW